MFEDIQGESTPNLPPLMTRAEVAAYLRTTVNALSVAHSKGKKYVPTYRRYGRRCLYRREDVEAALKAVDAS